MQQRVYGGHFKFFFYQIFSLFTFQMLSRKFLMPSASPAPLPTHSHFLALAFTCTGAYKVCKTQGSLFLVMAKQAIFCYIRSQRHELQGYWLVHIVVPPYRVADPFSSLGTFSSSSIGGPVFHPIADCEHPLLYLPGTGIASQRQPYQGPFSKILLAHAIVSRFGG